MLKQKYLFFHTLLCHVNRVVLGISVKKAQVVQKGEDISLEIILPKLEHKEQGDF